MITCVGYKLITIEIICYDNIISRRTIVSKFNPEGYCTTSTIGSRVCTFISSEDSGRSPEIKIRSLHSDGSCIVTAIGLTDSRDEIVFIWYAEIEVYIDRSSIIIDHLKTEDDLTCASRYCKSISSYFRGVTIVIKISRII